MALSPSHQFGQIIGELLEAAVEPMLDEFARTHGLYLDKQGPRPARKGRKVTWVDGFKNSHDLDFVLERGGSPEEIGRPVAFIETAWRRYTKHSRNKAQEIQGAILPLVAAHREAAPFAGVIIAGVFTEGSLAQLRSSGFSVLYFPYQTMVDAFQRVGLDARFDEDTPDREFAAKVRAWRKLSAARRTVVARSLMSLNRTEVDRFAEALSRCVGRQVESIRVLPLHGKVCEWKAAAAAIAFVEAYAASGAQPLVKFEIRVKYTNGDCVEANFADKDRAVEFLRAYLPSAAKPPSAR